MNPFRVADMVLLILVGFFLGALAFPPRHPPDLNQRQAVLECMSEVGYEAADPNASRLVQLDQSQTWCEQFFESSAP